MTAADHLALAEQSLDMAAHDEAGWDTGQQTLLIAKGIGHALIALAIEAGVPHPAVTGG